MWRVSRRMLRHHRLAFIGAFVAILFGVALVQACAGLAETGIRAAATPQRYAAAPVVVVGDRGIQIAPPGDGEYNTKTVSVGQPVPVPPDVAGRLSTVAGVARAVEVVTVPAAVIRGRDVVLPSAVALDWRTAELAPYRIVAGTEPEPGGVVVDERTADELGVQPGSQITLQARGVTRDFTVAGLAGGADGAMAPVFFSGADLAAFVGPAPITAVGVLLAEGADPERVADDVRTALKGTPVEVLTGDDRGRAESAQVVVGASDLVALGSVIGAMAAMIVMFLVTAMTGVLLQNRRGELALLRALGAAPQQVRRLLLGETLTVAIVAGILGCLIGSALGRWLLRALTGLGFAPAQIEYRQSWITVLIALGIGVVTAAVAALVGARRIVRSAPLHDLADTAVPRRWFSWPRLLIALLSAGGGVTLMIVTMTVMEGQFIAATAGPTFLLWAVTVALLGPPLAQGVLRLVGPAARAVAGFAGRMAVRNAKASPVRFAAVVTPIMLASSFILSNYYLQTTVDDSTIRAHARSTVADFVLTSATAATTSGLADRVRAVTDVRGAAETVNTVGWVREPQDKSQQDDGYIVTGIEGAHAAAVMAPPSAGSLTALQGSTVALTERHADRLGLHLGGTLRLTMDDGADLSLQVVALFEAAAGADSILLPVDVAAAHTLTGRPDTILVAAAPDADKDALERKLREVTAAEPGVVVADRSALTAQLEEQLRRGSAVNYLLLGLIAAYTVIAVVNTLATETLRRRREFALQRLVGADGRNVLLMVAVEAVLATTVGLVLGTVVSLTTLVPLSRAMTGSLMPTGPVLTAAAVVAGALVLTVVTALSAGRSAVAGRPVDDLAAD
ncbi:FtsX-like permease family protein [Dactylosporangium sp. NPDC000555]|uniref:FtsX-like permease family protein n=1 Tax=Dactylosporangium sp. NPDC000555 TaxID=3154260 RepID=UPI003331F623